MRRANLDMTGWIEFFTEGLATQLAEVRRRGEQAIRRDVLVGQHRLTARQALVLGHVLDHGRITIGELEELCPDTPRRPLQRDLKALVDKGLLVRSGSTNRQEYRPREGIA